MMKTKEVSAVGPKEVSPVQQKVTAKQLPKSTDDKTWLSNFNKLHK